MANSITDYELKGYHNMERTLFSRLIYEIGFDSEIAKEIVAFWLWLETVGNPDVIRRISSHDNRVLQLMALEAELCLQCLRLGSDRPPAGTDTPITAGLIRQPICRRYFYENRQVISEDISKILRGIFSRIFDDLEPGPPDVGQWTDRVGEFNSNGIFLPIPHIWPDGSGAGPSEVRPPFPTPIWPVRGEAGPSELRPRVPTMIQPGLNPFAEPWAPRQAFPPMEQIDDRTMFLTFSRGHPVHPEVIRAYFTRQFGNVVREIVMQRTKAGVLPLYARIVFEYPNVIPAVLNGQVKAKLTIGGRDVWARVYRERRN